MVRAEKGIHVLRRIAAVKDNLYELLFGEEESVKILILHYERVCGGQCPCRLSVDEIVKTPRLFLSGRIRALRKFREGGTCISDSPLLAYGYFFWKHEKWMRKISFWQNQTVLRNFFRPRHFNTIVAEKFPQRSARSYAFLLFEEAPVSIAIKTIADARYDLSHRGGPCFVLVPKHAFADELAALTFLQDVNHMNREAWPFWLAASEGERLQSHQRAAIMAFGKGWYRALAHYPCLQYLLIAEFCMEWYPFPWEKLLYAITVTMKDARLNRRLLGKALSVLDNAPHYKYGRQMHESLVEEMQRQSLLKEIRFRAHKASFAKNSPMVVE